MSETNKYSSEEILSIFQANYLQQQQFNPEVEKDEQLTFQTTIQEWRNICDLVEPYKLGNYLNHFFDLNFSTEIWLRQLQPQSLKTLKDICDFISVNAKRNEIKPIKLFGSECNSAAIFKYLMTQFKKQNIDIKDLKPSSLIEPFAKKNLGILVKEVNKIDPSILPAVNYKDNFVTYSGVFTGALGFLILIVSIWKPKLGWTSAILIGVSLILFLMGSYFKPSRTSFSDIKTFRDLIDKIQEKRLSNA